MLRRVVRGAVAVGVIVVAAVAGSSAAVAAATVTDAPVLLIACDLVVAFLVAFLGLLVLWSRLPAVGRDAHFQWCSSTVARECPTWPATDDFEGPR